MDYRTQGEGVVVNARRDTDVGEFANVIVRSN
ncbi:MAG: hypothetical protein ACI81P_002497 [Neolewinella sp.]|jgi:hypothetical protein